MESLETKERQIQSIFKAISFVEINLKKNIDIEMMATEASYSLFHFIRIFTNCTGIGPYDYLIKRRIVESAQCIMNSKKNLLDIALKFQFEVADTYTRAFRRCLGVNPSKLKNEKNQILQNALKAFSLEYIAWYLEAKPSIVTSSKSKDKITFSYKLQEKNIFQEEFISKHILEIYLPSVGLFNQEENTPYYIEIKTSESCKLLAYVNKK